MKSRWFQFKSRAILLRNQGKSIRDIESILSIPRSTLSGWLKNIKLTTSQYQSLKNRNKKALVKARELAIIWHNKQKADRLKLAEQEANKVLFKINNTKAITELALALLYLGEGFKKSPRTGISNSDPLILKFFLKIMLNVYQVDIEKIRFELHIRADQNQESVKRYWAKELEAPLHRFKSVSIDQRTTGKITYPDYKGVCVIDCSNIAIQRKLVYIGRKFCEKTIENMRA